MRALEAGTSRHGWVQPEASDIILDFSGVGAKDVPFFAAFGDDKSEEEDGAVVKGTRPKTVDDDADWAELWSGGGGNDGNGDNGGGDMGGEGGSLEEQQQNDCRDRKALDAQSDIGGESDKNFREHGVLIYRDANGNLQKSSIIQGSFTQLTLADIEAAMAREGFSRDQVVGFVHNHPDHEYGQTDYEDRVNRYPSGADWSFAGWLVSGGAGGANGEGFALYVIDTEGKMREFEYEDRSRYENLSNNDRSDGDFLPRQTSSDGSTCG